MKFEERIMEALANFVTRFHKVIPFVAIALFVLSIISAGKIKMITQIKDMLPANNPQVQSYEEIIDHFAGGSSVMITIEGTDKSEMEACAEAFVRELRNSPHLMKYVRTISLKLDRDFVTDWGLMMQKAKDLERTGKTFANLNLLPFITSLNDSFEEVYTGEEAEEDIETSKQENDAVTMLNQMETFSPFCA